MPYADPQTRRDRRRDYMRELMRERRARARAQSAISTPEPVSSRAEVSTPVSSRPAVSTAERVSTPVSPAVSSHPADNPSPQSSRPEKPRVVFRPVERPPTGLTPMVKVRARKLHRLFSNGGNESERGAARSRLLETAASAGVSVGDLMAAIGLPRDALDVPHA